MNKEYEKLVEDNKILLETLKHVSGEIFFAKYVEEMRLFADDIRVREILKNYPLLIKIKKAIEKSENNKK